MHAIRRGACISSRPATYGCIALSTFRRESYSYKAAPSSIAPTAWEVVDTHADEVTDEDHRAFIDKLPDSDDLQATD